MAGKAAEIAVDQIRTVDSSRIGDHIGILKPETAAELRHVITVMYGVLAE
jgi:mRNA-degrading endonuclease toxin of MazEF toxin-antitoxin module